MTAIGRWVPNTDMLLLRRLRPVRLTNANGTTDAKAGAAFDWRPCASPATLGGLEEGRWGLSLKAQDNAGLLRQSR